MDIPDPWPLRQLVLRTPRLELRPDDDPGGFELVEEAYRGIHPIEQMPFVVPWTDAPRAELGRNMLQYYWSSRATLSPSRWALNFIVRLDGRVVGTQGLTADEFGTSRQVATGSWLGQRHQAKGIGTEMRAAVLLFAFDHLGAASARSGAFTDNPASLRISTKLGYQPAGTTEHVIRGRPVTEIRMRLTPHHFDRPPWSLDVDGVAPCLPLLCG